MTATLTARDEAGARVLVLDCRHGTTSSVYANAPGGPVQVTDADVVRVMLARHYAAERCACTRHLRKRYGVV